MISGEGNIYIGAQVQAGGTGEFEFISIGNDSAFTFPYDTYIAGIFDRDVDAGTSVFVFVDNTGKLGTNLVDAAGNKMATPQAMHNESRNQQKRIAQLEGTVARQQKGMEVLTAQLKEQAAQIQKVSAQLEVTNLRHTWSRANSKLRNGSGLVCQSTKAKLEKRSPPRGERLSCYDYTIKLHLLLI